MRRPATPPLVVGMLSDSGRQRAVNQDAGLTLELPGGGLFAVADGMGGHAAGEVASNLALDTLNEAYMGGKGRPPERLAEAMQAANSAVLREATGQASGMGTTLVVALLDGPAVIIGHAGDSRAYLYRAGELRQLTDDHSWVAEQVRLGLMTAEEARDHQWRSIVSNALGGEEKLRLDLFGFALERGDRLLLCSDGLTTVVPDPEIAAELALGADPELSAGRLVDAANAGGGPDNITVLIVDVQQTQGRVGYPLPQRKPDGPHEVGVYLNTRRSSGPSAYLALTIMYLTLLSMVLYPEQRALAGGIGVLLLSGLLLGMWRLRARSAARALDGATFTPLAAEADLEEHR
jgi:PPM family protein phosphatase